MAERLTATARTLVNAEPAVIWAVITDPAQLGQAFFGADIDTDWRVGSVITYRGEWQASASKTRARSWRSSRTSACSSPTSVRSAASPTLRRTITPSPSN